MFWDIKPKEIEIIISSKEFAVDQEISQADQINIKIMNHLLQFIHIAEPREKNIPSAEQIKWALHSRLSAPLENYYYAFQIFQEDNELLAAACLLAKADLDNLMEKIKKINANIQQVYSEDKQFILFGKKIIIWQKLNLLARLNQAVFLLSLSVFLVILAGLIFLQQAAQRSGAELKRLSGHRDELAAKIDLLQNKKYLLQEADNNRKLNQQNLKMLYSVSAALPKNVVLKELAFSCPDKKIHLNGQVNSAGAFTSSFAQKINKIKGIAEVSFSRINSRGDFQEFAAELSFLPKAAKKIAVKTAKETEENG